MWCLRPGLEPTAHPQAGRPRENGASNFMLLKTSLNWPRAVDSNYDPVLDMECCIMLTVSLTG